MSNASTPLEQRKLELRSFIEARAKATQGEWSLKDNGYWSVIGQTTFSVISKERDEDGDSELITREKGSYENTNFIVLAANQAARIADEWILMAEALEKIYNYADPEHYIAPQAVWAMETLTKLTQPTAQGGK